MRVSFVAFTACGLELARTLAHGLGDLGHEACVSAPPRLALEPDACAYESLDGWCAEAFASSDALVFVSATGIALRTIAPYVRDKYRDPAVVCVDEGANFSIALLSGHVGGANELASTIAELCGAQAVITTATDVEGVFAIDSWAREQGLAILDRSLAKEVSARLLEGGTVGFRSDWPLAGALPAGLEYDEEGDHDLGVSVSLDLDRRPFGHTLVLLPRCVTVGMGCRRGMDVDALGSALDTCLAQARLPREAICRLASIDVKKDEPGLHELAASLGVPFETYSAEELSAVEGTFLSSAFVQETVGVDNVCERAACAGGARLLYPKFACDGVTVALAIDEPRLCFAEASEKASERQARAHLTCVGLGPGGAQDMTLRAKAALDEADVIFGYTTYLDLIRADYSQKELVASGMRGELERCRAALARAAAGSKVALVCSGDPGVYGMAGLLLELAGDYPGVEVEVIAGVTAASGGAAVLGAPLMHDWCSISLSDLLTPWELIERRLLAAAQADFVIALYNPASHGRADYLARACDLLLAHRSSETVCGFVRKVGREGQSFRILTLGELRDAQVDMLTCVFIGNSQTRVVGNRMVTPRGYELEGR